jgi:hypothetical protein
MDKVLETGEAVYNSIENDSLDIMEAFGIPDTVFLSTESLKLLMAHLPGEALGKYPFIGGYLKFTIDESKTVPEVRCSRDDSGILYTIAQQREWQGVCEEAGKYFEDESNNV